jgi:hypothetical protein
MLKDKQIEIDIANLRFYAEMFRQHEWSTVVIHWGVFEQTLKEIAGRIEVAAPPADTPKDDILISKPDFCDGPVDQLAFELAAELEFAELNPGDLVTVNRDKLEAIARRVIGRLQQPPADTPTPCKLCGHAKHAERCEEDAPNAQFRCACAGECPHGKDALYCKQCRDAPSPAREMEIALNNCRMLAQREIRNYEGGGQKPTGAKTFAAWKHILRFCEEVGVTGSVLRGDADTSTKEPQA